MKHKSHLHWEPKNQSLLRSSQIICTKEIKKTNREFTNNIFTKNGNQTLHYIYSYL